MVVGNDQYDFSDLNRAIFGKNLNKSGIKWGKVVKSTASVLARMYILPCQIFNIFQFY